jgi:hypothetical protein
LDSDDTWQKNYLSLMAGAIRQTDGRANYYFADTIEPPDKGGQRLWHRLGFSTSNAIELRENGTDWALMIPQPMMLQSTVFKRSELVACGGFLEALRYRDDTHLFLRLGVGRPICAVQGIGAVMTSDDRPQNRLTLTHDHDRKGILMRTILYRDLLSRNGSIPGPAKAQYKLRLAQAHGGLARLAWREGHYAEAFEHAMRSVWTDPERVWERVASRFGRSRNGGESLPE